MNPIPQSFGQEFAAISDDEKPFDIPQNWDWVRIGEITGDVVQKKPTSKITYIDIDAVDNNIYQITNPKIIEPDEAPSRARKVVDEGDVIYSSVRPYLKNVAVVPKLDNAVASTGFCVIKKNSFVDINFVFYYFDNLLLSN